MNNLKTWDAVVIGSGIGGLAAAVLLAKAGNKRVLVLERHQQAGGLTHAFRRNGASHDVGLHYVGDMAEGGLIRQLMDTVTSGAVGWRKMPEEFEHFVLPGLSVSQPSDPKQWQARLAALFPRERAGLGRWFRLLEKVSQWNRLRFMVSMVPDFVAPLLRGLVALGRRRASQTTEQALHRCIRDPRLRDLLTATWGDYGLPPAESALAIHALVTQHYSHGAWVPEGGAPRLARAACEALEARGGQVLTGWEAVEILRDEAGRVYGVRARETGSAPDSDPAAGDPAAQDFLSPIVVSSAGAELTFGRLLPGPLPPRAEALRAQIARLPRGHSAVTLYLRLSRSPAELGVQGENWWIAGEAGGPEAADAQAGPGTPGTVALAPGRGSVYLSFPSLKNQDTRVHTAQVIEFAEAADWPRDEHYEARKQQRIAELLARVEAALPGFTALVEEAELSTPSTIEHYTSHPRGEFYGLAFTPERVRLAALEPKTPVPGLWLAGSDAGSPGIVGALMGGVTAAVNILGPQGMPLVMAAQGQPLGAAPKARATLVSRREPVPGTIEAVFDLDAAWAPRPGQFARLEVAPWEWRPFSLAGFEPGPSGTRLTFLVSTKTGGVGSAWFSGAQAGDSLRIEGPFGCFGREITPPAQPADQTSASTTAPAPAPRADEPAPAGASPAQAWVFVAAGSGLAPLVPWLRQNPKARLIYACRSPASDLSAALGLPAERCYSREAPAGQTLRRVPSLLETLPIGPDTGFVLCGPPGFVRDGALALRRRGAQTILQETW